MTRFILCTLLKTETVKFEILKSFPRKIKMRTQIILKLFIDENEF
jgi:hypothetical protein